MVQEQFRPNSQLVGKKSKNWPLIIFISVMVGIIVIALIAWAILYSKGEVGLIGTSSNVDIYCNDCTRESKQQCQTVCEREFGKVNAPLLGSSMRTSKFGDKTFIICNCQGRFEDFQKILSGIETNWDEFLKIASEEGKKIQEELKQEQKEKKKIEYQKIQENSEGSPLTCPWYYDQPYDGMNNLPELLQYQYSFCALKEIKDYANTDGLGEKHLSTCDSKYVYANTNEICKYMMAYYLKDTSLCEPTSFGFGGSKDTCLDILNKCPLNSQTCIMTLALISGDYEICYDISYVDSIDTIKNRDRLYCIRDSNTFTGNEKSCEALDKELSTYNQTYGVNLNSDYCWMNVARVKKDESYCNKVKPGKNSRDCYTLVAVAKEDINICNLIKEDESSPSYGSSQSICYDNYKKIIF